MSASDLADEYDAVMADVIAVAGGCSQADWTTSCMNEQRSVGVVFDHIAELNPEVVRWVQKFLNGRPVQMKRNAEHARRAASPDRPSAVVAVHSMTLTSATGGFGGERSRDQEG